MVALLQLDKYGHRMETDRMVFFSQNYDTTIEIDGWVALSLQCVYCFKRIGMLQRVVNLLTGDVSLGRQKRDLRQFKSFHIWVISNML